MRNSLAPLIALLAAIPVACSTATEVDDSKTGGAGPVGGSVSSSGGAISGGAPATGGAPSSGGVPVASGGTMSLTGGAPSSGGVPGATGGNRTGGAPSSGGVPGATGGTTSLTGGAPSSGGIPGATGGVGTCTDTPPPNGTCADAVAYGWCGQSWMNGACALTCGLCGSGTGGASSTGGKANTGGATNTGGTTSPTGGRATGGTVTASGGKATGGTVTSSGGKATGGGSTGGSGTSTCGTTHNASITGSTGWATRYWDCCKPSCAWTTAVPSCAVDGTTRITNRDTQSGCTNGTAYECYDFTPWYDSATNMSYGFAAYNGASCGACFQLQFTGATHGGATAGAQAIAGDQMIVQVINIGGLETGQFDLLIPGGGVGAMTAGCTAQWGNVDLGATYGGLLTECNGDVACVKTKCQTVFSGKSALLAGCSWFTDCYRGADNPVVTYKQVTCPSQLTSKTGVSG